MKKVSRNLNLSNLWINRSIIDTNVYKGKIEFENDNIKFELAMNDDSCKKMLLLVANEIRNAKSILADELELAVKETSNHDTE